MLKEDLLFKDEYGMKGTVYIEINKTIKNVLIFKSITNHQGQEHRAIYILGIALTDDVNATTKPENV